MCLWSICKNLSPNTDRIDIAYDMYLETSMIYNGGRKCQIVETKINSIKQNLPVELDKFWDFSNNKIQLQKVFITLLYDTYSGEKSIYLGGAILDNITSCIKLCGKQTSN